MTSRFHYLYLSFHYLTCAETCPVFRLLSLSDSIILFIMFVGKKMYVHTIKYTFYPLLGTPLVLLTTVSNIFLIFPDMPGFKFINYPNITLLGSIPLLFLRVQVWFDFSGSTFAMTEVLVLSNLYRKVVSARSLASLGYVFVCYFLLPYYCTYA